MAAASPRPVRFTPGALDCAARIAVVLACLATAGFKAHVMAPIAAVGHGDTSFYFTLAQNLTAGRGFVVDYVPDFLSEPRGLPHPATSYWMPLVSVYIAAAMAVFGGTFATAKGAMIALTSLAPALAYTLGREAFGRRRDGLFAAGFIAGSGALMTSVCMPQTLGVVLVIGSLWFVAVLRAREDPRWLLWVGALIGAANLTRSDGLLLWPMVAIVWLLAGPRRWGGRRWTAMVAAYAMVMAPLWALNATTLGHPLPRGSARAVLATDYRQIYALPESLTLDRCLGSGTGPLIESRRRAAVTNAASVVTGPAVGSRRVRASRQLGPHEWALLAVAGVGVVVLWRRRCTVYFAYVLVAYGAHTLLLAETGRASLRCMLLATYPLLFAAGGHGVERCLTRVVGRTTSPRRAEWIAGLAVASLIAVLAVVQVRSAATEARRSARWLESTVAQHLEVRAFLAAHGLEHARVMVQHTHHLHANTGLSLVQIPNEPEPVIHAVALRLGVTHLLLAGEPELAPANEPRGGDADIPRRTGRWQLVARRYIGGQEVRLYRVVPPV